MPSSARYTEMKQSGIEWVGEIPSRWNVKTLNQLVSQVKNKNSKLEEKNLLSLSYGKIKLKDINSSDGLLPASFDGYNIIEADDIVLRLTDLQNDHTSLRVGLATERGIITSAYITLRPFDVTQSKYLYYLLHSFDIKKGFYGMGSGVRQGLNYGEVKELRIALPLQNELEAIAPYLDMKCAEIDELISDTKTSIEEYKLWKSSVIFEAVTKGLDSNAEMKDSGIEWMGKISSSSSIIKLRFLIEGYKAGPFGSSLITDKLDTEGKILVYTPEHIANQCTDRSNNLYLPEERKAEMSQFAVRAGDIIFPIVGSLGRAMLIKDGMPTGIINQRLAMFRLNENLIDTGYFLWMFAKSSFFLPFIEVNCRGSFIQNLTKTIVYDMPVIIPESIETQRKIAAFLDKRCAEIDSLIIEKESLIYELEAYKQSLIYEAVTGKRKVCNP